MDCLAMRIKFLCKYTTFFVPFSSVNGNYKLLQKQFIDYQIVIFVFYNFFQEARRYDLTGIPGFLFL